MNRRYSLSCLLAGLISLTFCSCKNMPSPLSAFRTGAGSLESPGPAAPQAAPGAAPVGRAPGTEWRSAATEEAARLGARQPQPAPLQSLPRAQQAVYTGPSQASGTIQRLSHEEAADTLAPIVPAASLQQAPAPSPAPAAPTAPAPLGPAPAATPMQVTPEGQVLMSNPPAGSEFEWAPIGGCGPSCGPACPSCGPACQDGCRLGKPFVSGDEFLCDGGDIKAQIVVDSEFNVHNIDMTDTVGHYDTLDGQRLVEESNRVCIYAPRFAAVRRIDKPIADDVLRAAAGIDGPRGLFSQEHHALVGSLIQPVQPEGQLGTKAANALLERDRGLVYENIYAPSGAANPLPAWENFEIIQRGVYLNTEKPRLQEHIDAALVWMTADSVEVLINEQRAQLVETVKRPQETLLYEMGGKPRLRICKVASTDHAQPGDIVDFTIRFDNVGDQKIGNVTILDSLTTRLEYVEDSQQCSVKADFFTVENEGQSLVLRWEVIDPLKVGEGGVIRFKCRVR